MTYKVQYQDVPFNYTDPADLAELHVVLDPQPKYGKPFQVEGGISQRFYNLNPSYPRGPMFSYSWLPPKELDATRVRVEMRHGIYVFVGPPRKHKGAIKREHFMNTTTRSLILTTTIQSISYSAQEWGLYCEDNPLMAARAAAALNIAVKVAANSSHTAADARQNVRKTFWQWAHLGACATQASLLLEQILEKVYGRNS